jgi:hypothetical protein
MNPVFTINFRREAYEREQARIRARVVSLGAWVAYFGLMAVILGLYGLNAVAFARRTAMIERQAVRQREMKGRVSEWTLGAEEMAAITRNAEGLSAHWRIMMRIGQLLPPNARLTSLAYNPDNLTGAGSRRLVVSGVLRPESAQDRVRGVVNLVSALGADSSFSRAFTSVKLASTSSDEGSGTVEFTIECR